MTRFLKAIGVELVEVSWTEKAVATLGGGLSILLLVATSLWAFPPSAVPVVIASMGASAVLLFAVPHGPLSQPWPVIAGHTFSALIGVTCARFIPSQSLAAACAVGLAIGTMHQFKCIHPPGGATALTAVLGGHPIHQLGFGYVLFPVLANALAMVALAFLLNRAFRWRRYPHPMAPSPASPTQEPQGSTEPTHEEIVAALKSIDSFVDISEEDLLLLTRRLARPRPGAPSETQIPR